MNVAALTHFASEPYCYPLNSEELIINIKTGHEVEQVFLIQGDPYDAGILGGDYKWNGREEEIIYKKRLQDQTFWTTTIRPEYKRCRYYFRLVSGDEELLFFEDGTISKEEEKSRSGQCYIFPWMNEVDCNQTPAWVNDTIWYQIFPDRFCRGKMQEQELGIKYKEWKHGPVTNKEFYGGNLSGILHKLPYLKELGINGIYLTPIFASVSTHKYDTSDYFELDPGFGSKEDLRELIQTAHKMGIRIMLDGVFNHSGRAFPQWQDVVEKGSESPYFNWFMIHQLPVDPKQKNTRDHAYESFAFEAGMPKLNTNEAEVREYFISVCRYWKNEFEIDGIRLDVANEISHRFCKELRKEMKKIDPEFFILGEVWHNALPWLRGDEFDSVMNYPLSGSINDFFRDKKQTKQDFEEMINRCYTMYMQQTNDVLFNLLDSHDTIRLRSKTESIDEFYQQLAILFSMPGSPCVFYGTEIAMAGAHDPDCRRCMPWDEIEEGKYKERINHLKELIHLRRTLPALKSRHFHFPNTIHDDRVAEYVKIDEEGTFLQILINAGDHQVKVAKEKEDRICFHREYKKEILYPGGILIRELGGMK